jgi:hypothetical protein
VTGKETAKDFQVCSMGGMDHRPPLDAPRKMVPFVGRSELSVDVGVPANSGNIVVGRV